MRNSSLRIGTGLALVTLAGACLAGGCTGGGETVISGLGNSGNRFGTEVLWEALGHELATRDATPPVTDEELLQLYSAIKRRALEGELEPALVVLRVAEEQRESDD